MANIRINFQYPTTRTDGSTLLIGDINDVQISARVVGAPTFTPIAVVVFPLTTLLIQDVAPGEWEYQAIVRGAPGNSEPVSVVIAVPFAVLSPASNMTINLE